MNTSPAAAKPKTLDITIRPLLAADLDTADHVMRVAFGTFIGIPEPASFMGDMNYVHTRWETDPAAAFAAEVGGELVGSNFATNWGSVGFFGPLTIRPDYWDAGIGKRLIEPVVDCFDRWGTTHACLFTFAQSQKHVGLYQRFGFWPRFLTSILAKPVDAAAMAGKGAAESAAVASPAWGRFSALPAAERAGVLAACRALTDRLYPGLDLAREIQAVAAQGLGETLLLWDDAGLAAFAVCHSGPRTEAGSGACYVKFAAVRPGPGAGADFERLLDAVEALAAAGGLSRLVAGVNTGRNAAYRALLARGYRSLIQGVAMHRANDPGYNDPTTYALDDWR